MPAIQSFVRVTHTALNGVAAVLAILAVLAWARHYILVGTATSMAHALIWTVVAVVVMLSLTAAERLAGV